MVEFWVAKFPDNFSPDKKKRLQICHRNFTTFFTQKFTRLTRSKETCHLVLALGTNSRNVEITQLCRGYRGCRSYNVASRATLRH